tara:strand:- start:346 stop:483 length:138 start_codon:yes stop_codon:yes gene_type:complete
LVLLLRKLRLVADLVAVARLVVEHLVEQEEQQVAPRKEEGEEGEM